MKDFITPQDRIGFTIEYIIVCRLIKYRIRLCRYLTSFFAKGGKA